MHLTKSPSNQDLACRCPANLLVLRCDEILPNLPDRRPSTNLAFTMWALRRGLQNVIRHARIGSCNSVEDVVERDLITIRVAVLAGFD